MYELNCGCLFNKTQYDKEWSVETYFHCEHQTLYKYNRHNQKVTLSF